ncbi:MAG TPA: serpin family protein [Gemmatimonadaceae bacterium]|nr:serpin family protein [Gemmatimonadaceae bacterium]
MLVTRRRTRHALPVLLALLPLLAACEDSPTGPRQPAELTALPRPLSAAERQAVAVGNDFSVALFREVNARKAGENVFISPFSAAAALGMALNGANGATFDAMRTTLGFEALELQAIDEAYHGLTTLLLSLDPSVTLGIANAIFHDQHLVAEPAFLAASRDYFDAEVQGLDFADAPASLATINHWASEKTQGRIPKVLDELDDDEMMFLLNALYFKGAWRSRFDPARTQPAPFRLDGGGEIEVPMMARSQTAMRLGYVDGAQVLELPYGNGAFAMTVVLPPEGTPVDAFVATLTPAAWDALLAGLHDTEGDVWLPRFKLSYHDEWTDVLTAMGMGVAFDPNAADFSRLSSTDRLYLTRVLQDAVVEVNEEGTEAAAVTTVGVGLTSAPPGFRADRPFVFAIRERLSGTILFVGKVVRPSAG